MDSKKIEIELTRSGRLGGAVGDAGCFEHWEMEALDSGAEGIGVGEEVKSWATVTGVDKVVSESGDGALDTEVLPNVGDNCTMSLLSSLLNRLPLLRLPMCSGDDVEWPVGGDCGTNPSVVEAAWSDSELTGAGVTDDVEKAIETGIRGTISDGEEIAGAVAEEEVVAVDE